MGLYQSQNNALSVTCKSCSEGSDAPNKEHECLNCPTGRYQKLKRSITYGCTPILKNGICDSSTAGSSLENGQDVQPGMLTIRLFQGPCCVGKPLTAENMYLDKCMLGNAGSVIVSSYTVESYTGEFCEEYFCFFFG